jgi:hypothetical protein
MIGNLGKEIKQHSNPFANLSQRGIRHAQVNAIKAMIPDLEQNKATKGLPHGAIDLEEGYVLLRVLCRIVRQRPCESCCPRLQGGKVILCDDGQVLRTVLQWTDRTDSSPMFVRLCYYMCE